MRHAFASASLALALTFAVTLPARADAPPDPGALRRQVHERVQAMLVWKLTEALSLDEASAQRFFPVLRRHEEKLQPIRQSQGELFRRLHTELESGHADPAKINKLIDDILVGRGQLQALEMERLRDLRKVLTPVQAGHLVAAMPRIEQELRREVRHAMRSDIDD